jgi:hypothetical protein
MSGAAAGQRCASWNINYRWVMAPPRGEAMHELARRQLLPSACASLSHWRSRCAPASPDGDRSEAPTTLIPVAADQVRLPASEPDHAHQVLPLQ